jgi:DNA modification methylase/sporulation protein YlmC with PRC-barrel domain
MRQIQAKSNGNGNGHARTVSLKSLKPDSKNANVGTERGSALLEKSLREYGAGRSILLDKNGVIIGGNKTWEQAGELGFEEVIVVPSDGKKLIAVQRTDLDIKSKRGKGLALSDNRVAEVNLEWSPEILKELNESGVDLSEMWSAKELEEILGPTELEEAPEPKLDQAAELQKKWGTKLGQLWLIGPHRLLCGDSTKKDDVARLWGTRRKADAKAALMATDPPYGVAYGIDSGADSAQRFGAMTGDAVEGPQLQAFLESVFQAAIPYLRDDAAWYLWHAQLTQGFFAAAAAAQLKVHRQIIWVKNHFILGHGDYHWQHELCFYGWREGSRARWFAGRDQSTIWNIDRPSAATSHPTEKPAEIFARSMRNNTEAGEICYEPFAGSGTQLCAAEQAKRICYALEIEPKYVAVALERMSDMGLNPKLAKGESKA